MSIINKEEEEKVFEPDEKVAITQRWLSDIVIGEDFCPPLHFLAREHRTPDGEIDWEELSIHVPIVAYPDLTPTNSVLVSKVASDLHRFTESVGNGVGPMSKVWVLSRFASNGEYDIFMASIKDTWMSRLMQSKKGHNVMRKVLTRLYNEGRFVIDTPVKNYTNLVGKNDAVTAQAAWGIVERSLSPSYF